MVMLGQPKTASEYIQATSRVGRHQRHPVLAAGPRTRLAGVGVASPVTSSPRSPRPAAPSRRPSCAPSSASTPTCSPSGPRGTTRPATPSPPRPCANVAFAVAVVYFAYTANQLTEKGLAKVGEQVEQGSKQLALAREQFDVQHADDYFTRRMQLLGILHDRVCRSPEDCTFVATPTARGAALAEFVQRERTSPDPVPRLRSVDLSGLTISGSTSTGSTCEPPSSAAHR